MNTWSPLFSKIVDSSLWDEDDFVVKIFITMLAKKDADHVVRGNAYNIAQWAKKPTEEARVIEALKRLQEPDTKRLEPQLFEGRRVEKVADGYLILNGQFYENLMRAANRRAYKAAKQREYRSRDSNAETKGEKIAKEMHLGLHPGALSGEQDCPF